MASDTIYEITYDNKTYKCKKEPVDDFYKYVTTDNQTLVMYSPGYGSGWSTWNRKYTKYFLFDIRIIDYISKKKYIKEFSDEEVKIFIKELFNINYYDDLPCLGGFWQLEIKLIPKNTMFKIREYDGSESIEIFNEKTYFCS